MQHSIFKFLLEDQEFKLLVLRLISVARSTVDENIIANTKIRNIYVAIQSFIFAILR